MLGADSEDHDQRLKVLLKEFFEQFFLCFFPVWAARFDFSFIDWLDKEVFLGPPQGEKRQLDLVARLRLKAAAPPPQAGMTELVALVHVEIETRKSSTALQPRMFEYYVQLRRDLGLPVLPIGLFLRVGLEGSVGTPMRSTSGSIAFCASSMLMSACPRSMPPCTPWERICWAWPSVP
ncbi:MAG TPA: hypothetical protein VEL76_07265 [Gemmataceae bacterium]|nr:hypothetical protein [Gemmataceae bacterium]